MCNLRITMEQWNNGMMIGVICLHNSTVPTQIDSEGYTYEWKEREYLFKSNLHSSITSVFQIAYTWTGYFFLSCIFFTFYLLIF